MCLVGTLLYGNNMPSFQSLHFRSKSDSLNYIYYNIYIFIFIYRHTFYYISPVSPPGSILRGTTSTFNLLYLLLAGLYWIRSFWIQGIHLLLGIFIIPTTKQKIGQTQQKLDFLQLYVCLLLLLVAVAHTVNKL